MKRYEYSNEIDMPQNKYSIAAVTALAFLDDFIIAGEGSLLKIYLLYHVQVHAPRARLWRPNSPWNRPFK